MILDIDHFKRVNDTYGHDAGDRVLKATGEMLRSKMRPNDIVCRMGGEEFLTIGAKMDSDAAMACAERLRSGVEDQTIELSAGHVRVTISIGVATRTPSVTGFTELLKNADSAVYFAKSQGRNCVCSENTPQMPGVAANGRRR